MVLRRRVLAAVLTASLLFGSALTASAADPSPKTAPAAPTTTPATPTKTPSSTSGTYIDTNTKDHNANTVVSTVKNGKAAVTKIKANGSGAKAKSVEVSIARDANGKAVPITSVEKNALKSSKVTKLTVKPNSGKTIVIKKNAFNKSKIKKINLNLKKKNAKVRINKNAFSKTKAKKVTFAIYAKKANQVSVAKGAFKGLNKKSVIKVKKTMSKSQFKKLKKALKKAGFKGTIKRF